MEFKETHPLNALLPIEVTENGTLIVFNDEQIVVTAVGISTLVNNKQPV